MTAADDPRRRRTGNALVPLLLLTALTLLSNAQPLVAQPATTAASPTTLTTAAATAPSAEGQPWLRAQGNDDRYWIVSLRSVAGAKGRSDEGLIYRRKAGDDRWTLIPGNTDTDVVALGSRLTQLALLYPNGTWQLLSDETLTTGPTLPGGAKIITFGSDGGTLWAIGELTTASAGAPASGPAATAPSATTRPAATGPSTLPAGVGDGQPTLVLYSLQSQGWVRGSDLPPAASGSAATLSLCFADHEPVVAWRSEPTAATVMRLTDGIWLLAGRVSTDGPISRLRLLDGTPRPVLWVAAGEREASLTWLGSGDPKRVVVPVDLGSRAEDLAATYANGRVRVVGFLDGKLAERTFDPDPRTGEPLVTSGSPSVLPLPKPPPPPTFSRWGEPFLVAALIYVIIASVRRREQMRDVAQSPTQFVLAPVGRRLLAGTIDAIPVLVACGLAWWQFISLNELVVGNVGNVLDKMAPMQLALCGGGVALYLLHTALGEALAGRSVGKAICGLRVVGLDGRPAPAGAVVTRNLLRVIDLCMFFFPLMLILFSPLRQRAGDVAAGTLVVLSGATQPAESEATGDRDQSAGVSSGPSSTRSDA